MELRVGDVDRERVAALLRDRCLEGYLDADELDERVAAALRARTQGELTAVVADLPAAPRPARATTPPVAVVVALVAVAAALALLGGKTLVLLAGLATLALIAVMVLVLVAFGPWIAAGAGVIWLARWLQGHRRRVS